MKESCPIIEPLLAAYALDALGVDEKHQVEAHVAICSTCQHVLEDYQSVSDGLMAALPPILPPARVRAHLLARTAPKTQNMAWLERWDLLRHKLIPVTAIAAILILLVFNVALLHSSNQMLQTQETLAQQNRTYQTAFALLSYPDSQVAVIDDRDIYGTLVYDPDGQVAVLNVWGLKSLPEGQDYQIWLIEPDQTRISGGVFQSLDQTEYVSVVIESPNSLETFSGLGVTIEPEGGSPGPTGPRVFGLDL